MNHTKEPWSIKCHTCATPEDIDGGDDYTITGEDGTKVAFEPCEYDPNKGADARRIVACVNACAGMDDANPIMRHGGVKETVSRQLLRGISTMKQRDALLAEKDQNDFALLKAILEIFDIMGNPVQFRAALEMAVEKRTTAIASVKGQP